MIYKIIVLHNQGYSYEIRTEINTNLTEDGITKFLKWYKETRSLQNKTNKSKKRCTSVDDNRIEILSLSDRRKSSENIYEEMAQCNVMVSARTVLCRLKEFGPVIRIPQKKVIVIS